MVEAELGSGANEFASGYVRNGSAFISAARGVFGWVGNVEYLWKTGNLVYRNAT